ncbi:MAG: discoidin domain-containing protein [Eubacteriales bacterium]
MKKISILLVLILVFSWSLAVGASAASAVLEEAAPGRTYLTANVNQDTLDGTESFANEEYWNLFDGDTATKFCTNVFPATVTWQMDTSYMVDAVVIATANDNSTNPGRNPATYVLSGSPDGTNYTVLYEGTAADLSDVDYTYFLVNFNNNVAYPYYKFEVPAPESGTVLQISEIVLCSKQTGGTSYPSSAQAPSTGSILGVSLVGYENGWGDNAAAGRAAAFDGDINTFYDPMGTGDGYCGVDCGEPYILTQVNIHSRSGYLDRYLGAMIQGSDDDANWTTLYTADAAAPDFVWTIIPASDLSDNTGYRYYRYYNETSHGDVAEVEFYGLSVSGVPEAAAAEAAVVEPAAAAETDAAAVVTAVQTADIFAITLIALAGSSVMIFKKRR